MQSEQTMQGQNFTTTITVDQGPIEVFDAINDVGRWWTGDIEGDATAVGDEFSYRYPGNHFSRQLVTELIPGKSIVWSVVDAHLERVEDPREWVGTEIRFEIAPTDDGTDVNFTHVGLRPDVECFDACSGGWNFYLHRSLQRLISTGEGPTPPPWA